MLYRFGLLALLLARADAGYCNDRDASCANWARQGECAVNEGLAAKCPLSCGTCQVECEESNPSCVPWAQDGQCEQNPLHMYKECPISCGICAGLKCKDMKFQCPQWAENNACNDNVQFPGSRGMAVSACG